MPVPPQTVVPAPIEDLRLSMDEKGATLSWSRPGKAENGEKIKHIEAYEVWRAEIDQSKYCDGCPVTYTLYEEVILISQESPKKKISFLDSALRPQYHYLYTVRSRIGWRLVSKESKPVSMRWLTPAAMPEDFMVKPGDQFLSLAWQPPKALIDGAAVTEPVGYAIYRGRKATEYKKITETDTTSYRDITVTNGEQYFYRLRAFRVSRGDKVFGPVTEAVAGIARDFTPPLPPQNVNLVKTEDGITVFWDVVQEEDLAGFRIYRRAGDARPKLLGEVHVPSLSFLDKSSPASQETWYYSVSTFDRARPPNESVFSNEAVLPGIMRAKTKKTE